MTPKGRQVVWMAMLASNLMMFAALAAIPPAATPNPGLGRILLALGMAVVPLAAALPHFVKAPQAWLAAMAICEMACVLGIIAHAAAGFGRSWMLPLLGLVGTGLLYPARDA